MQDTQYDAVVVGSGAAGCFAVKELTEQGLRVLLLEAGPDISAADFPPRPSRPEKRGIHLWPRIKASLLGQHIQARLVFFNQRFKHFFVNDRHNPYITSKGSPFLWIRGRQIGGRLHTFGRVLLRWSDLDFKGKSLDGQGEDWPISYADIAPYYAEIEEYLEVRGNRDHVASLPDGNYATTVALVAPEQTFKEKVEQLWPGRHVVSWRYMPPFPKRIPKPLLDAQATGLLTYKANTIAARILCDQSGRKATSIECIDAHTRQRVNIAGKIFIICGSPIETTRLLLNSKSKRYPNGIGNTNDTLGRYFMDQCPSIVYANVSFSKGLFKDETGIEDSVYPPSSGFYIPRYENTSSGSNHSFYRGYTFQGMLGRIPVEENENSKFVAMGFGEMLPYPDNRITVDERRVDRWGIPVAIVHCKLHKNEKILLEKQQNSIVNMIEKTGGSVEFYGSPIDFVEKGMGAFPDAGLIGRFIFRRSFHMSMTMGAAIHESGGARMGNDPKTSYLDAYNRCWEVPNLLVTDASSFPSSGSVGTTLTVMALTVRACRQAAQKMNPKNT